MRARFLAAAVLAAALVAVVATAAFAAMSPVVSAKLSGRAEVPKGPAAGSGLVIFHLNATKGQVCWDFKNVTGIDAATAAHIHKGSAGAAGPVIVPLGAAYKAKGCTSAPKQVVAQIEEHPNRYYANVHTAKYPAGAIRGQLAAGMTG